MKWLAILMNLVTIMFIAAAVVFRERMKKNAKANRIIHVAIAAMLLGSYILLKISDDGASCNFSLENPISLLILGGLISFLIFIIRNPKRKS